ncbi:hypothetical protein M0657_002193 [Pyricularia oryzae]|nr:hypothetical protein M9X92_005655 [Pyricularia oryzae]KAI7929515.1 hypothetical protein M0657_002193 [Pyricularia oryzae]
MQCQARVVSVDRVVLTTYGRLFLFIDKKHQTSAKACWCSSFLVARCGRGTTCWRVSADNNRRVSPINIFGRLSNSQLTPGCFTLGPAPGPQPPRGISHAEHPWSFRSRRLTWTDDAHFSSSGLRRSTGPKNPTVFGTTISTQGVATPFLSDNCPTGIYYRA